MVETNAFFEIKKMILINNYHNERIIPIRNIRYKQMSFIIKEKTINKPPVKPINELIPTNR